MEGKAESPQAQVMNWPDTHQTVLGPGTYPEGQVLVFPWILPQNFIIIYHPYRSQRHSKNKLMLCPEPQRRKNRYLALKHHQEAICLGVLNIEFYIKKTCQILNQMGIEVWGTLQTHTNGKSSSVSEHLLHALQLPWVPLTTDRQKYLHCL